MGNWNCIPFFMTFSIFTNALVKERERDSERKRDREIEGNISNSVNGELWRKFIKKLLVYVYSLIKWNCNWNCNKNDYFVGVVGIVNIVTFVVVLVVVSGHGGIVSNTIWNQVNCSERKQTWRAKYTTNERTKFNEKFKHVRRYNITGKVVSQSPPHYLFCVYSQDRIHMKLKQGREGGKKEKKVVKEKLSQ